MAVFPKSLTKGDPFSREIRYRIAGRNPGLPVRSVPNTRPWQVAATTSLAAARPAGRRSEGARRFWITAVPASQQGALFASLRLIALIKALP
jgi:hypothetical protein